MGPETTDKGGQVSLHLQAAKDALSDGKHFSEHVPDKLWEGFKLGVLAMLVGAATGYGLGSLLDVQELAALHGANIGGTVGMAKGQTDVDKTRMKSLGYETSVPNVAKYLSSSPASGGLLAALSPDAGHIFIKRAMTRPNIAAAKQAWLNKEAVYYPHPGYAYPPGYHMQHPQQPQQEQGSKAIRGAAATGVAAAHAIGKLLPGSEKRPGIGSAAVRGAGRLGLRAGRAAMSGVGTVARKAGNVLTKPVANLKGSNSADKTTKYRAARQAYKVIADDPQVTAPKAAISLQKGQMQATRSDAVKARAKNIASIAKRNKVKNTGVLSSVAKGFKQAPTLITSHADKVKEYKANKSEGVMQGLSRRFKESGGIGGLARRAAVGATIGSSAARAAGV